MLGFPGQVRGGGGHREEEVLQGERVQHAHRDREGTAPCQHRGGKEGACPWGWDSQRQDSDRRGQFGALLAQA